MCIGVKFNILLNLGWKMNKMSLNTLFILFFIFFSISIIIFMSESTTHETSFVRSDINILIYQSDYNYDFDRTFYEFSLFNGNFSGIEQMISYFFAILGLAVLGDIFEKFLKSNKKDDIHNNRGV